MDDITKFTMFVRSTLSLDFKKKMGNEDKTSLLFIIYE